jgi:hypothetical protein
MRKTVSVSIVAAVVAAIVVLVSCTGGPKTIPNEEAWSKLLGEWVNPEYSGIPPSSGKLVIRDDLTIAHFGNPDSVQHYAILKLAPRKSWSDREGYVYLQGHYTNVGSPGDMGAMLYRVDGLGKTLEYAVIFAVPESGETAEFGFRMLDKWESGPGKQGSLITIRRFVYHRR